MNIYELELENIKKGYKIKMFSNYDEKWLDFILECRNGSSIYKDYDVLTGGIADDRVYNTMELYIDNLISKKETLKRLKYYKPNNQICIVNQEVIDFHFDNSMLHLDCVFSLIGEKSALVSPYVYDKEVIEKYIKNIIEVTKEEADNFATNIVYLGDKKLVTSNISVGNKLKELGYDVTILDYTEIVKGEGSVDCSTLALLRE